jgi:hypothetical protein
LTSGRDRREGKGLQPLSEVLAGLSLPKVEAKRKTIAPPAELFELAIRPEDIGYTHPIFVQCFLPLRHRPTNAQRWQTDCGRASLVIRAGELIKPGELGKFKPCAVPAGPKARIINAYISDYALRHKTPRIPLGASMRDAMAKMDIPIGGHNGKELQRELENLASAEIILGVWDADGSAHQEQAKIAKRLSFWIDKDDRQRTLWQPEMDLSSEYYSALTDSDRMAPIYWPALVALQGNPRAMDIHSFLSYRLHKGLKRPVTLPIQVLHQMFGRDIKQLKHFVPEFKRALIDAHKWYPTARVELLKDNSGLVLKDSPALIPYKKLARLS